MVEGIPPVSSRLVERIRRWEYIDLALLLEVANSDEASGQGSSDMFAGPPPKMPKRSVTIRDMPTWLTAYARFMAVLLATSATKPTESAGLAAHMHLILQVSQDLGGRHWMFYDKEFWEWAASKAVKVWGDLNLSIYGRCLSCPLPPVMDSAGPSSTVPVCIKWNQGNCNRPRCKYLHQCLDCGGTHRNSQCPLHR